MSPVSGGVSALHYASFLKAYNRVAVYSPMIAGQAVSTRLTFTFNRMQLLVSMQEAKIHYL